MSRQRPRGMEVPRDLDGRVAVVTGSSAGIGAATAHELAARGAAVVVHSRDQARCDAVAADIEHKGGRALALAVDLSDEQGAAELIARAVSELGHIDVLVNNAGRSVIAPALEMDLAQWRSALDLLLTAPFVCARAAASQMIARGEGGVIVNVSSIFGHLGVPQRAAYCAAKHGLIGLTRVLASEWARDGIRVVSVDPGYIETELVQRSMERASFDTDAIKDRTPAARMGRPDEVARVIGFMASDSASYVTGASWVVDGGWTAYGGW